MVKTEFFCLKCGKKLTQDDRGLYRKLIDRTADDFLCVACISEHFHVDEELMREKIAHFKAQGCSLFF